MDQLCKHTQFRPFTIFEPLYRNKTVLLAKRKVGEHNKVTFTGNPSTGYNMMGTAPYYISGKDIKKYKTESNGTIAVVAVPLDALRPLELAERCEHDYK